MNKIEANDFFKEYKKHWIIFITCTIFLIIISFSVDFLDFLLLDILFIICTCLGLYEGIYLYRKLPKKEIIKDKL